jgi:transcription elongation factor Elf1
MLPCPKCGSTNVGICTHYIETTTKGWGIRVVCKDCDFAPPKSKWHWFSSEKAIEIWNGYKR